MPSHDEDGTAAAVVAVGRWDLFPESTGLVSNPNQQPTTMRKSELPYQQKAKSLLYQNKSSCVCVYGSRLQWIVKGKAINKFPL